MAELRPLPVFLEDQDEEIIRTRMLARVPATMDITQGSFWWDTVAPVAVELGMWADWADLVLRYSFVQTTYGPYLDMRADEFGLVRRAATTAIGEVRFRGEPMTLISAGTVVSTESTPNSPAILFRTLAPATIGPLDPTLTTGHVDVDVVAVLAGTRGNVPQYAVKMVLTQIANVSSVINLEAFTDGTDRESDHLLRQRVLERARSVPGVGNTADYTRWAHEIPGIGAVAVEPLWNGPGTVRVIILDTEGNIPAMNEPDAVHPDRWPAEGGLVEALSEYLDPFYDVPLRRGTGFGKAPIGALTTVISPKRMDLEILIPNLVVAESYSQATVEATVTANLVNYVFALGPGSTLYYHDLEAIISDTPGTEDFDDIMLSIPDLDPPISAVRTDVTFDGDEMPMLAPLSVVFLYD